MGLINRVLSFFHAGQQSETTVDPGGGASFKAPHFSDPGDDSATLPDDYALTVDTQGTGAQAAVGYVDTSNARKSQPGDKRIYARASSGSQVSEVWLKNDGSIAIVSSGSININGVTIAPDGSMVVPMSLVVNGIELATHTHAPGTYRAGQTSVTGSSGNPQ